MQKIAEERGGKCLSNKYINAHTKLEWQCAEGHQWEASPDKIKQGTWCPVCAGNTRFSIKDMQKIAEERGGKCLSKEYINNSTKLSWICAEGHQWEASPIKVKKGTWCPKCSRKKRGQRAK